MSATIHARADAAIKRLHRAQGQPRFDNTTARMMRDAEETLATLLAELARLTTALEHLAYPNRGARPTGQDALDMAAFAARTLAEEEEHASPSTTTATAVVSEKSPRDTRSGGES